MYMKKVIIVLLAMIGLVSCNGGKTFKIKVNLDNSTGKTVLLQKYAGGDLQTLQTAVANNNTVEFKVNKSDNTDALHLMIDGWRRPVVIFADNQNMTVSGDYQKAGAITVTGSDMQARLNQFIQEFESMEDENAMGVMAMGFVKENIDNPMGAYVLYRYKWAFSENDMKMLYQALPVDMQSGYKVLTIEYLKGLEKVSIGKPYTNIIQNDVNGNAMKLSDMIGKAKVIIIDFWASWCPDCRKENPELVKIYNEYKNKGLDIFSVSLDNDAAAWKKGITDDNLSWSHHVSDLQGWKNAAAGDYCISFIPQNVVLDENGVIVKKNVPMNRMRDVLNSFLK